MKCFHVGAFANAHGPRLMFALLKSPRQFGEPCVAGYPCGSGLMCAASSQVCKCTDASGCTDPTRPLCVMFTENGFLQVIQQGFVGGMGNCGQCAYNSDCASGQVCDQDTLLCKNQVTAGGSCTSYTDCASGFTCLPQGLFGLTCQTPLPTGSLCNSNTDCVSGKCTYLCA